jgi:hypothetical protein
VAAELQLQVAHFRRRRKLGSYHLILLRYVIDLPQERC